MLAVLMCLLAPTDYLFVGYYEQFFGRILRAGPVLDALSITGAVALAFALREWWLVRQQRENRLADIVVLYVVTGSLLLFGNLPAIRGYPIYTPANFMIIPTIVLAVAILRFGALPLEQRALLVNRRTSAILLILFVVFAAYAIPGITRGSSLVDGVGYTMLLFAPLFLAGFQFTFLFSRPLAKDLDASYAKVEAERMRAEAMFAEVRELNDFSRRINESADLEEIKIFFLRALLLNFNVESIALFLRDETGGRFVCRGAAMAPSSPWEVEGTVLPDDPAVALHALVAQRKRPAFLRRPFRQMGERDEAARRILGMGARLWIVPLSIHGSTIGLLDLFSTEPGWRLTRAEVARLGRFCDQGAGALRTALLMQSIRDEKVRAERAHADAEMLAQLARKANGSRNLGEILEAVLAIARDRFGADTLGLFVTVEDPMRLELRSFLVRGVDTDPGDFPTTIRSVPLRPESGTLFRTFRKRKRLYVPSFRNERVESPIDIAIMESLGLRWFVHLPLIVEGDVVGILVFTGSAASRRLSQEDLDLADRVAAQTAGAVRALELLTRATEAQDRAEAARVEAEAARRESSKLAEISRILNETSDLARITDEVFRFLKEDFGLKHIALLLEDPGKPELFCEAVTASPQATPFWKSIRVPLTPEGGSIWRTYERQKTAYLPHLPRVALGPVDTAIIKASGVTSFIHVPLVVQARTVGVVASDPGRRLFRNDVRAIERFCGQIAGAVHEARLLREAESARAESDRLLVNILPAAVAAELKREGSVRPLHHEAVTVLFTDFVGFTAASQKLTPSALVQELDGCFSQFDEVARRYKLEKLKTIGDAYMCAAGLPLPNPLHAVDACLAALEFRAFMAQMAEVKTALGHDYWQIRIGIHSGPVTAGVIGTNKFAYDIWGDTVNTASRMESASRPGEINISPATFALVRDLFECKQRGKIKAKGKGALDMYFLKRIKPELSADADGRLPNARFEALCQKWTGAGNPTAS